ncbi:hypothetical protein HANVADRAFT_51269 [Hanseniaspora valbyensis NRRL Y-1626]|uniref:Large ribosomal subunit protein mL50 n=1 Tax=Hanseniaspora valbyensis NRRL Y-1626 TaxID=766949 RepID=A0A1B7TJK3_9ASCO|nr:hypothetical protein HANVADRAFT_51269 [Hanseniaspora valbyensis NRRL Y-1626]
MNNLLCKINKRALISQPQKTVLLQQKRTGFFDFLGRGKSDEDEKKEILNKSTTKEETKQLAESLVKGETESSVDSKTEIKVLDMKNTRVIGDNSAYETYLNNLKEHRISSLKINDWSVKTCLQAQEFENFETILKELLIKYNLELNELSIPFKDFQTKFLFSKDIQAKTGIILSDYNITLFASPKDYKTFFYEVVLSGELYKYQEKKPLAIKIDVVSDSEIQTDKEIALKRLQAEFSDVSDAITMKYKDFNSEYQQILDSMVERTKVFRPQTNNIRVKTFRTFKDQNTLKQKLEQEVEYSHSKLIKGQNLEKS